MFSARLVKGSCIKFLPHALVVTPVTKQVLNNKDHQRMMVDPMSMIVWNLRLFQTAVTPTAVTPTEVIFLNH